jgi:RNA polymerase primary sigma factor
MSLLDDPGVRRAIADTAARRIASEPDGLSARAIGNDLNDVFASEPATRNWVLTRRHIETVLSRDHRFICSNGQWHLSPHAAEHHAAAETVGMPVSPLRAGVSLKLRRWQLDALSAWSASDRRGIVQAVTGSGKTRVGLAAIAEHLRNASARVAVLVPTIELQSQWIAELRAVFGVPIGAVGDAQLDQFSENVILVFVARSAADLLPLAVRQVAPSHHVLLVADECHRYGSAIFAQALNAPFAATLGLSATPERDGDNGMAAHVLPRLGPVVYEYDHHQAISEDVIADFRVCFVGVDFEPRERDTHDELSDQIARAHRALIKEYPFVEHASPFIAAVKHLAQRDEDGIARRYLQLTAERRRLLYGASSRHDFVFWLADQKALHGERLLMFHETIADCEHLAHNLTEAGITAGAHHSALDRETRRLTLTRFARGELSAIIAPRTLDEGIDVPDASLAIIVAGTRVKRQTVQRIGRVLRKSPEKPFARVVKVFVRGSADDPTGATADAFSRELLASGRGLVTQWPADSVLILQFMSDP